MAVAAPWIGIWAFQKRSSPQAKPAGLTLPSFPVSLLGSQPLNVAARLLVSTPMWVCHAKVASQTKMRSPRKTEIQRGPAVSTLGTEILVELFLCTIELHLTLNLPEMPEMLSLSWGLRSVQLASECLRQRGSHSQMGRPEGLCPCASTSVRAAAWAAPQ